VGRSNPTCSVSRVSLPQSGQGFEWTNVGRGTKWGFVGSQPGASLNVSVPVAEYNSILTLGFGFLISYQHMGVAMLQCLEGCSCPPKEYSFHHPNTVSITSWRTLEVNLAEGSEVCKIQVTIANKTKSSPAEHKVKLSSVMTTEERDFILPYLYCDECIQ